MLIVFIKSNETDLCLTQRWARDCFLALLFLSRMLQCQGNLLFRVVQNVAIQGELAFSYYLKCCNAWGTCLFLRGLLFLPKKPGPAVLYPQGPGHEL